MEKMELPKGWVKTKLSKCCVLNQRVQLDDELEVAFIPMAELPTTFFGNTLFEKKLWKEVKRGYTQFQNNDVLLAKITPCFENGKATLINNLPNGHGAGSTEYFVLRSLEGISPKFLYSIVKSFEFLILGAANMSGSVGHRRVPKAFVENYSILLPPLAEQQEIVRIVESHLKLVEQIKSRLDALPKKLQQFRQSVLASAMSDKRHEYLPLSEILTFINGFAFKSSDFQEVGDYQVLRIGNIKDKEIRISANPIFVSEQIALANQKVIPLKDDLLISMTGTRYKRDYGFVCRINTELKYVVNQRVGLMRRKSPRVTTDYLYLWLSSKVFRDQFFFGETGGVNQGNVGSTHIKSCIINFPKIDEQEKIVKRVENLFSLADQIESKIKNAQERVNLLTQSILAKAFRGEFTAKWREENPDLISGENSAEALLKRIEEAKKSVRKSRNTKLSTKF